MRVYVDEGASVQLDRQRKATGGGVYDVSGLREEDRERVLDHPAVHPLGDDEAPPLPGEDTELEERVSAVEASLADVRTGLEELWARVVGGAGDDDDGGEQESSSAEADERDPEADEDEPEVDATDAARALAAEHGLDLTDVEGTGQDGRVLKSDVEAAVAGAEG